MHIIKWSTFNLKSNSWGQPGKFQSTDENILEFMVKKNLKKWPSRYQRENTNKRIESCCSMIAKPVMVDQ